MRRVVASAVAVGLLYLVLIQPNHPAAATPAAFLLFPLELPAIVLGLLAAGPGTFGRVLRVALVGLLGILVLAKLADFASFLALSRGFNPVTDWSLSVAAWRLATGAVGFLPAAATVAALVIGWALLVWALWWATGRIARSAPATGGMRLACFGAAALGAAVAAAEVRSVLMRAPLPVSPPGAAFTARLAVERVQMIDETLDDLRRFRRMAQSDPLADRDSLLSRIDRDVLVLFVESYARTSHDVPLYAPTHRATLERAEATLRDAGFAMRSGFLRAPTRGGQSWLSHASFATGLPVDDQSRYLAALASGRDGLFHVAQDAGFVTAAVMPAITLDWPEADFMGFDRVLPAAALGYAGEPFNWVTMPDQFTLSALDRLVRDPEPRPVFAQVALISSHAPWVPVPRMVPWDALGDGRVFDPMATSGPSPETVWRDHDRVRLQYRKAVDYALTAVFDYAERQAGPDAPLILVLGDHPAAEFVAQDSRADVPMHVVGPPHLVAMIEEWGWHDGLLPHRNADVTDMHLMRDRILRAFSVLPEGAGS